MIRRGDCRPYQTICGPTWLDRAALPIRSLGYRPYRCGLVHTGHPWSRASRVVPGMRLPIRTYGHPSCWRLPLIEWWSAGEEAGPSPPAYVSVSRPSWLAPASVNQTCWRLATATPKGKLLAVGTR